MCYPLPGFAPRLDKLGLELLEENILKLAESGMASIVTDELPGGGRWKLLNLHELPAEYSPENLLRVLYPAFRGDQAITFIDPYDTESAGLLSPPEDGKTDILVMTPMARLPKMMEKGTVPSKFYNRLIPHLAAIATLGVLDNNVSLDVSWAGGTTLRIGRSADETTRIRLGGRPRLGKPGAAKAPKEWAGILLHALRGLADYAVVTPVDRVEEWANHELPAGKTSLFVVATNKEFAPAWAKFLASNENGDLTLRICDSFSELDTLGRCNRGMTAAEHLRPHDGK